MHEEALGQSTKQLKSRGKRLLLGKSDERCSLKQPRFCKH